MAKKMSGIKGIAWLLIVIGAINWGLVGLFGFNLVEVLFGFATTLTMLTYILIGLAGLYELWTGLKG